MRISPPKTRWRCGFYSRLFPSSQKHAASGLYDMFTRFEHHGEPLVLAVAENGWQNARGKTVGNADLWQQCAALLEKHVTEWTDEEHSYRRCMLGRLQKEMEREHELKETWNYLLIEAPEWNTGKGNRRHEKK